MLAKNDNPLPEMTLAEAQARIVALEHEIDSVNTRLIQAEGGKSYFISHALNELNNPLTAITGLIEQVSSMDAPSWDQVRPSLMWIRDESSYLEFQLKNLFSAAELEAGVAKTNLVNVDVRAIMNAVSTRYVLVAQKRGVRIETNGGHALLSMADAMLHFPTDSAAFTLIYANLLDNAIKWSPMGGVVRVRVDIDTEGLKLSVADQGPGLPEGQMVQVFDRFWQADSSTTKRFRGLGLGMSVSADSARQLGGHLQIEGGQKGVGLAFCLALPLLEVDQLIDASDESVFFFDDDTEAEVEAPAKY